MEHLRHQFLGPDAPDQRDAPVWQTLLAYAQEHGVKFSTMRRTAIGGAAVPLSMLQCLEEQYQVEVLHAWGMTEMSPLGTVSQLNAKHASASGPERQALRSKQGRAVYGVDLKIVAEDGRELAWDGKKSGELFVRGSSIARDYFKSDRGPVLRDGWFPTGHVATIDPEGYVQVTDRSKDVIKSGGVWIRSIELENIAISHPSVAMGACIAIPHPRWGERPLLVVARKVDAVVDAEQILAHFDGKIAKWQIPDAVAFVEAIPLGPTGKTLKSQLRQPFCEYRWP